MTPPDTRTVLHPEGDTMNSNHPHDAVKKRKARRLKNDRKIAEAARKKAAQPGGKIPAEPGK